MQSHDVSTGAKVLGALLTPVALKVWSLCMTVASKCNLPWGDGPPVGLVLWDPWVSGLHVYPWPKIGLEGELAMSVHGVCVGSNSFLSSL